MQPSISYNGQTVFDLPEAKSDKPSSILFSLPKSGSKMVRGILRRLAHQVDIVPVGAEGGFVRAGIPRENIPPETSAVFLPTGYFYHFSNVPTEYEIPIDVPTLVHVRDPRDALVSKVFSHRKSHPLPGDSVMPDRLEEFTQRREKLNQISVDDGVMLLADDYFQQSLKLLAEAAKKPGAMFSKYEDMVYRKVAWAEDVCAHFGWRRPHVAIRRAVEPYDVFPDKEQPDLHVRQVHPGNHKRKLKPETIEKLNDLLGDSIEALGYQKDG